MTALQAEKAGSGSLDPWAPDAVTQYIISVIRVAGVVSLENLVALLIDLFTEGSLSQLAADSDIAPPGARDDVIKHHRPRVELLIEFVLPGLIEDECVVLVKNELRAGAEA